MDADLQRRVQRYGWDKASAMYERYWAEQLAPVQRLVLEFASLAPGEHVLDIACGTGLVTFPAAAAVGASGRVVATDLSAEMIKLITALADERGVRGEFLRQNAERLELPDGTFDAALCALGLMYVPDAQKAVREMHRVLKRGGRGVAAVWGARKDCGWAEIFPIVERRVETRRIATTLDYASADAAIGSSFAGGPVALAYSRFDEAARESAHAEYLESLAAYRHGSGYRVPGEFVVTRGVRES